MYVTYTFTVNRCCFFGISCSLFYLFVVVVLILKREWHLRSFSTLSQSQCLCVLPELSSSVAVYMNFLETFVVDGFETTASM